MLDSASHVNNALATAIVYGTLTHSLSHFHGTSAEVRFTLDRIISKINTRASMLNDFADHRVVCMFISIYI